MDDLKVEVDSVLKAFHEYYPTIGESLVACGEPDEEVSDCLSQWLRSSQASKNEIAEMADASWRMCFLQHRLIQKFRPQIAEAMCEAKDRIIDLQDQLVKKKDEEIEQLRSLADRVETSVKSYSEAVDVAAQQAQASPPDLKQSVREAVKEVAQEGDLARNMMVFGLAEEEQQDLEKRVSEILVELGEKPKLVGVERLGRPHADRVRAVRVTLTSSSVVGALVRQSYRLSNVDQFRRVYLAPDRSRGERERRKALVENLKEKRTVETGQKHTIRNGEIHSRPMPDGA